MRKSSFSLLLAIPYIVIWQISYAMHIDRFIMILPLMFPLLFLRRSDVKLNKSVFYSILLSAVFIFMLIEPGVAYGKAHLSIATFDIFHNLLYAFLFSISIIAMLHLVVLKNLWNRPFAGMTLTALVYVLSITPYQLFFNLSGLASLLLFNIAFLVVFSYFIGFLYLKSNMNLLSSLLFLLIYSIFLVLNVNVQVSKLFNLVWEVISLTVLLYLSDRLLKESIRIKRAFKSKRVVFRKKDSSIPVIFGGIVIVLLILVVMPFITQESHYAIADPTDSMYPVIQPGSLLFVSHIDANQVKVGTIIVFNAPWENGTLFAHEVINITYNKGVEYFVTKGVNNPAKDPLPVPVSDLVGKVALSVPYAGYLLIYSKFTAAVILIVAGVFYFRESKA